MLARLMGLKTLDPATLRRRMQSERLAIFDVNSGNSWRTARVPGARHLDPTTFLESDLPNERDHALVFYCSNPFCRKAPMAARRAKQMGYRDIHVLSAGISGWLAAGLPTESGD
ncbi:MAG TPA: rhodanese-like domain-containing protein [Thermoanaerobaculia bacterium]|nr:rhodanese-like domain-containing protein [Thermoanaerobaculia bacterium]